MFQKKHTVTFVTVAIFGVIIGLMLTLLYKEATNPENSYRAKNEKYLKERCGAIIIEYYQKYGTMPESLEDAMVCLDRRLPHRGDYYGGSTSYERINDHSFSFIAYGKNEKYDFGKGDDIVVTYDTDKWL